MIGRLSCGHTQDDAPHTANCEVKKRGGGGIQMPLARKAAQRQMGVMCVTKCGSGVNNKVRNPKCVSVCEVCVGVCVCVYIKGTEEGRQCLYISCH